MRVGLSWLRIVGDLVHFLCLGLRSRASLAAENLFLRKQLAFYQERKVKPRRADNPTRLSLVLLSRWFNWRDALIAVRPRTLIARHRKGFRLFWRWKSEAGRRPTPVELQRLIQRMARENASWGEERIANELLLKLGLRVSPRTIRKYMPKLPAAPASGPRGEKRCRLEGSPKVASLGCCPSARTEDRVARSLAGPRYEMPRAPRLAALARRRQSPPRGDSRW